MSLHQIIESMGKEKLQGAVLTLHQYALLTEAKIISNNDYEERHYNFKTVSPEEYEAYKNACVVLGVDPHYPRDWKI